MSDIIVSIRMPSGLHDDLKRSTTDRRFLDLSEAVRSIVRKRWTDATVVGTKKIEAFRDELVLEKRERRRKELTRQIDRLSQELRKMGEELEQLK